MLVAVIPPRRGAFLAVSNWTKDVTAAEVTELVQAFVDKALAAQEGRPSPGDAISAG
ncbi:hypothetical protein [Streptomyces coeruleorubidus]|uniref:hypothetical protein n=1 Tax=Streptomyces coeruleorubidus TaxID=116188 RepID=UPI00142EC50F|nr:hypothetical protein [Streptomyces coeruleorubidus]GGT96320.1 hypothetical protein GCM10010256_65400 [Streptomyces coeruleorubidus]